MVYLATKFKFKTLEITIVMKLSKVLIQSSHIFGWNWPLVSFWNTYRVNFNWDNWMHLMHFNVT